MPPSGGILYLRLAQVFEGTSGILNGAAPIWIVHLPVDPSSTLRLALRGAFLCTTNAQAHGDKNAHR